MHSADAVVYPVERSRRAGLCVGAIWLAGMASVSAWCATVPAGRGVRLAILLCAVSTGCAAARWWWRSGAGLLCWNGQDWSFEPASKGGTSTHAMHQARASVALDLQGMLLLRLHVRRRVRWVVADRCAAPGRWHGLRCAVTAAAALPPPASAGTEAAA